MLLKQDERLSKMVIGALLEHIEMLAKDGDLQQQISTPKCLELIIIDKFRRCLAIVHPICWALERGRVKKA